MKVLSHDVYSLMTNNRMMEERTSESSRVKEVMVDTRINKVLALRTDSVAMLEALNSIGEFYETNTVEARRSLRYHLETYNVENGKKFLEELKSIKQHLETTETLSNELNEMCSQLKAKVEKADSNMKSFIEKTSSLEKSKQMVTQSKEQIEYFISKFHMSEQDIQFLQSANLNHSNEFSLFFQKLSKLKESFVECQKLAEQQSSTSMTVSSSSGPSSATVGSNMTAFNSNIIQFELLEVLGNQKENAYHYLFQWIKEKCEFFSDLHHHVHTTHSSSSTSSLGPNSQQIFQLIASEENQDTMHKLQIAIAHIKDIPLYFQQCQDLLIPAKRNILMNRFMIALTQGETNPNSSNSHSGNTTSSSERVKTAIDLQSHDPMLYVSAMLAWMHQAVAAEKEYLEAIYNDHYHVVPSSTSGSAGSKGRTRSSSGGSLKLLNEYNHLEMLSRIIQTVAKPLRIRIFQTLETHNTVDILYGLADLLVFYENIFHKLLSGTENAIHACLKGCFQECKQLFRVAMKRQIEYLLSSANQSSLLPNPLQAATANSGGGGSSSLLTSSYVELKVSMTTREYAKLLTSLLRIGCNALSSLPFLEQSPEMLDKTSSTSTQPVTTNEEITTLSTTAAIPTKNIFQLEMILGDFIQPLLQYCRMQVSKLGSVEMAIYMLNNIGFLQHEMVDWIVKLKKVMSVEKTQLLSWEELLVEESKIWKEIVIHQEIHGILKRSELDQVIEKIDLLPPAAVREANLSPTATTSSATASERLLGLTSTQLETILKAFYSILFTISLSNELEKVMNPRLREEIRVEIAKAIGEAYAKVYRFIQDERNQLDRSILLHSMEQVNVLLGSSHDPSTIDPLMTSALLMEDLNLSK